LLGVPPLGAIITIHWAKIAMAAKNASLSLTVNISRTVADTAKVTIND